MTTFNARIGGKVVTGTLADISAAWANHRDTKHIGNRNYKSIIISDEAGAAVAYLSYNAKVWPGTSYDAKADPIFDPSAQ